MSEDLVEIAIRRQERRKKVNSRAKLKYKANPELEKARSNSKYQAAPEKGKDVRRAITKAWRIANPEKCLAANVEHRLGLGSYRHYIDQEAKQNGLCPICRGLLGTKPHRDHNKDTGQWRSILCPSCNWGLGQFKESIEALEAAIAYLKKWGDKTCPTS